jgi:hypothetical protein
MLSGSKCIVAMLLVSAKASSDISGLRGVSQHRAQMSFANILSKAMRSDAFQKQVSETVPMMCDQKDDDQSKVGWDPATCKKVITKSLLCTSFLEKAKSLQQEDVAGVDNFIARCKSIERQVPNLSSVFHWVQNPEEVFQNVVNKAQGDTGINLMSTMAAMQNADKGEAL